MGERTTDTDRSFVRWAECAALFRPAGFNADPRTEELGVRGDGDERLGRRLEQQVADDGPWPASFSRSTWLPFAFHTSALLAVPAWREALVACGVTYRLFESLRTITGYAVFHDWPHLLRSIAAADLRPP
jgi:hypothetical protein